MKNEYFINEDYGLFCDEKLYSYGDIIITVSKNVAMGVLLKLRGTDCSHLEHVLRAIEIKKKLTKEKREYIPTSRTFLKSV